MAFERLWSLSLRIHLVSIPHIPRFPHREPLHWGLDVVPHPEMRQLVPAVTQCEDSVSGRTARLTTAGEDIFTSMMSFRWSLLGRLLLKPG